MATTRKATSKKVSPEERYKMVQEAAYLLAERGNFAGDTVTYWLSAEKEVDAALAPKKRARRKVDAA